MNKESAKKLFAAALADSLSAEQLAAFEAILEQYPQLCNEFETYADANAGVGPEINNWLEVAAETRELPSKRVLELAEKRGKLIPIFAGLASLAAAAAIAVVMMLPSETNPPEPNTENISNTDTVSWPTAASEQVVFVDDSLVFLESWQGKEITRGVHLDIVHDTHVRPRAFGMYLFSGEVKVKLDEGAKYLIRSGDIVFFAKGPALFTISSTPQYHPEVLLYETESDPMFRHRSMLRLGAAGLVIGLSVFAGDVSAAQGDTTNHYAAGSNTTIQAAPQGKYTGPPKASDIFDHVDANSDGKLDSNEVDVEMITKMDDDSSGDIDLTEFEKHFKLGRHGRKGSRSDSFYAFKTLDANSDDLLDSTEIDATELADWDKDSSGDVDLNEFLKAHGHPTVKDTFDKLDQDSDGYLDSTEVSAVVIGKWDGDSDAQLDETEFTSNFDEKTYIAGEAFDKLDADTSGYLDSNEADEKTMKDFDDDSSNDIDFDEFLNHFKAIPHGPSPEDAFAYIDANSDGVLDNTEVDQKMFAKMDYNKDGQIDLAEFKNHFKQGKDRPMRPRRGSNGGPPSADDIFDHVDANSDGVLDSNEVDAKMITKMDDDNSGDIDLTEFKKHFKPGMGGHENPSKGGAKDDSPSRKGTGGRRGPSRHR